MWPILLPWKASTISFFLPEMSNAWSCDCLQNWKIWFSINATKVDISCRGVARSTEKAWKSWIYNQVYFFDAVRIVPGELLESVQTIEEDFKVCAFVSFDLRFHANITLKTTNIALYIVAQWAIPLLQALSASSAAANLVYLSRTASCTPIQSRGSFLYH